MKKLILSTLLMAGVASAADQAMIVFDASGSMESAIGVNGLRPPHQRRL